MYENIYLYSHGQLHGLASRLSDSTPPPQIKKLRLDISGHTDNLFANSICIILFRTSRLEHVDIPKVTQSFTLLSLAGSSLTTLRVLRLTLEDLQLCQQLNLFQTLVELVVTSNHSDWARVPDWTLSLPSVRVAGLGSSLADTASNASNAFIEWVAAARFQMQCQLALCIPSMTEVQSMLLEPLFESHRPRSASFVNGHIGSIPSLLESTEKIQFMDVWMSPTLFSSGPLPAAIYFNSCEPEFVAGIYDVLDSMLERCRTSPTKITRQTQIFIRSEEYPLTWGTPGTHLTPAQASFVVDMMHYTIQLAEYNIIIVDRSNTTLRLFDVDVQHN
jgi:hypothetical protein